MGFSGLSSFEWLKRIQPVWVERTLQRMARTAGVREDFRDQLEKFYGVVARVVETGQIDLLDSSLALWASSLTVTDLEEGKSHLTHVLREMLEILIEVSREEISAGEAFEVMAAVIPIFSYAFEKAAQLEIQARLTFMMNELNRAQQSLEKLEKTKSDFIAVAAHELKTPLTLVEGYSAMLRDQIPQTAGDGMTQMLIDGIHNGTRRLRLIVDDMIDVSLIDNSLLALNFQPVWINRLLAILAREMASSLAERKQTLKISPFEGSDEMTFGDPERLLQLFRNLLSNAIKYTPDGGKITVEGRKLPGFLEITLTDSGIGIAVEDQPIIFEKFVRLGNTALHSSGKTKFKGGGPGLGLRIARGIIESHGGAIWVESDGYDEEKLPGSKFHVMLPMRAEPPDARMAKLFAPLLTQKK